VDITASGRVVLENLSINGLYFYKVVTFYNTCRVVTGTAQMYSVSPFLPWMSEKATTGLTAHTSEMNYVQ
jgi:hypothetical protein